MADQDYAWVPSEESIAARNWTRFARAEGLDGYDALAAKAAREPEWFWNALIRFLDVRFQQPYERVLDLSKGLPWAEWCVGGTTNLALNCLDKHLPARADHPAIEWEGEDGGRRHLSYGDVNRETCRLGAALQSLGIGRGDVVGLFLPNVPEAVCAFLAVVKIGAIVTPLFSGFGASAVATRLNDSGAKAVIACDGTWRRGKLVAMKPILDEALSGVPAVRHAIVLRRAGDALATPMTAGRDHWWHDIVADKPADLPTPALPAETPLLVVYTSGTTGKAKGTVHSHCGLAAKTAQDFGLCFDLQPADRMLWMSDMGWLVGPITITSTMFFGATLVMAEGTPDYPEPGRLWRLVQDFRVTFLGITPTVVRGLKRAGDAEVRKYDLSSIRVCASTGEPWDPESWMWLYQTVLGRRTPVMNYSGGTEMGGIVATNLTKPIKPCSFSGPIPGTGADIVDDQGKPMAAGQVGELVMTQACIGLTRGLYKDPDRYIESYWSRIPNMWVHGDWASRDADGSWYIHGRSDDTIKVAGKRTGPAEIESLLLGTRLVTEAAAIGVDDAVKGTTVVCAVIPAPGVNADAALRADLSNAVVAGLGPGFRPREVIFVRDLPKTRNMKVMRRAIRAVYDGKPAGDLSSLVNPETLDELAATLRR